MRVLVYRGAPYAGVCWCMRVYAGVGMLYECCMLVYKCCIAATAKGPVFLTIVDAARCVRMLGQRMGRWVGRGVGWRLKLCSKCGVSESTLMTNYDVVLVHNLNSHMFIRRIGSCKYSIGLMRIPSSQADLAPSLVETILEYTEIG